MVGTQRERGGQRRGWRRGDKCRGRGRRGCARRDERHGGRRRGCARRDRGRGSRAARFRSASTLDMTRQPWRFAVSSSRRRSTPLNCVAAHTSPPQCSAPRLPSCRIRARQLGGGCRALVGVLDGLAPLVLAAGWVTVGVVLLALVRRSVERSSVRRWWRAIQTDPADSIVAFEHARRRSRQVMGDSVETVTATLAKQVGQAAVLWPGVRSPGSRGDHRCGRRDIRYRRGRGTWWRCDQSGGRHRSRPWPARDQGRPAVTKSTRR